MNLTELKQKPASEIVDLAEGMGIEGIGLEGLGSLCHAPHLLEVLELQVPQPLPGERARQPRLEDRRVERLRQVVGRPELDAADDALELVDAGDHDHGEVTERLVGLDAFERLVPVELRHHHVEEHDIEGRLRGGEGCEGLGPGARVDDVVPLRLGGAAEQPPAQRVVVDDENPAGRRIHPLCPVGR